LKYQLPDNWRRFVKPIKPDELVNLRRAFGKGITREGIHDISCLSGESGGTLLVVEGKQCFRLTEGDLATARATA